MLDLRDLHKESNNVFKDEWTTLLMGLDPVAMCECLT